MKRAFRPYRVGKLSLETGHLAAARVLTLRQHVGASSYRSWRSVSLALIQKSAEERG